MNTPIQFEIISMRLNDKREYYKTHFSTFCQHMALVFENIAYIEIGKQDQRGGFSVSIYGGKHIIINQKLFDSKNDMLGFIVGFNTAKSKVGYI